MDTFSLANAGSVSDLLKKIVEKQPTREPGLPPLPNKPSLNRPTLKN